MAFFHPVAPSRAISSKLTKSSKEETEITGLCHRELGIQENVYDSNLQQECLFLSHLLTKTIKKASVNKWPLLGTLSSH